MTLYSPPPPMRTFHDDKPTLLVCWWCTCFAAVVILFRVAGRYIRTEKLFKEDWIAFACLIPMFIRMGLVHVILLWGTNNALLDPTTLSDEDLYHRAVGSRLVLASRIFYAATLWMLKLTISEFFKRLTLQIWKRSYEVMLQSIRWFLLISFVAVVISDISECQPITHYWQVLPDPGPKCRQAYVQLITMGSANVITDLLLVVFPIPIIIRSQMGLKRKIQLVALFAGSAIPVGISLYRIPNIIERQGVQQYRSLWASVEILLATAVANALVLGSFIRDRGVKKAKWKFGSISDSMERQNSRRGTVIRHWGSDEDLVAGLGIGVDPELRGGENAGVARPAPMAVANNAPVKKIDKDWNFPTESQREGDGGGDGSSEDSDMMKYPGALHSPNDMTSMTSPKRRVSFFDVGGLLDDQQDNPTPARKVSTDRASLVPSQTSTISLSPTTTRKGSAAFLQDVGGLLSPKGGLRPPPRYSRSNGGTELQSIPQESQLHPPASQTLQDVGGLLSK